MVGRFPVGVIRGHISRLYHATNKSRWAAVKEVIMNNQITFIFHRGDSERVVTINRPEEGLSNVESVSTWLAPYYGQDDVYGVVDGFIVFPAIDEL